MKSKEQKRQEAQERQERYDKLTLKQKYDRLLEKPGECQRERARLLKQMAKQHKCGDDCKCGQTGVCCTN